MSIDKDKLFEFVRYCIVGTIAAGLHYGIYYLLQMYINVNVAYTLGYVTSLVCNFFLTSYLTFRTTPSFKKAVGFGASHIVNYLLHIGLFNLFLWLGVSRELAPLLVLAIAVPTNFLLLRLVFRYKKQGIIKSRFTFRPADLSDVDRICEIIRQAKEQMRRLGSRQWQDGYPARQDIIRDIEREYAYVLCEKKTIVAYGAVIFEGEPAYEHITEGDWLNDGLYVVVHRLAVADEAKQRGIATRFMREVEALSFTERIYQFRVDTNFDNYYMHKMLARLGFTYCGKIEYERGERLAYQKDMKWNDLQHET